MDSNSEHSRRDGRILHDILRYSDNLGIGTQIDTDEPSMFLVLAWQIRIPHEVS